jgi:nitroreductase
MTRDFDPSRSVSPELLDELVELAARAPSAGKAQGWHLVLLTGPETARFWDVTLPETRRAGFRWTGLLSAPVIALALADPVAYVERYAEADKAATGWGAGVHAWPAPYWTIDASMAVMTVLLGAQAAGLGALLFAVDHGADALRASLGVPDHLELLGAVALGWPAGAGEQTGRSAARPRRSAAAIVHHGRW